MSEPLVCPVCDVPMLAGRVELHAGTAARVLLDSETMGVRLRFIGGDDDDSEHAPDLSRPAWACTSCDGVFLGSKSDAFACFECNTEIPADADACPACGWTW